MKFSWLFNGTMEAHHLAAAYLAVWLVQGGYAAWVIWQCVKAGREARRPETLHSVTRDHF